jgi:hypothetical protein
VLYIETTSRWSRTALKNGSWASAYGRPGDSAETHNAKVIQLRNE